MSWSRQGYENASYCISTTGRQPAMQRPTAAPRIPASDSGVSTQRSGPNRSRRPAVARNTPPSRPTSSPRTITESSRPSSTCSASLTASTRSSSRVPTAVVLMPAPDAGKAGAFAHWNPRRACGSCVHPPELVEVPREVRGRFGVSVREDELAVGGRLVLRGLDRRAHRREGLVPYRLGGSVVEQAEAAQVVLVDGDAVALLLGRDAVRVDVEARVVRGRVRRRAIGDRLHERGAVPGACACDGVAHRLVDGEHVVAVDP